MTESSLDSGRLRARINDIPGYPGYKASEDGFIYSLRSGRTRRLSPRLHNGYWHVNVNTGHTKRTKVKKQVHQLVLLAFVGQKPSKQHLTRHLDGNPLNNHKDNLRWGTPKENARDSITHGTAVCLRKGQRAAATKLSPDAILNIEREAKSGMTLSAVAIRHGISINHVARIRDRLCHPDMWHT
ncbi:HNH endonuclease [Salmonella enterica]|nr:HNH endonuclease [Salmonella enterica]